MQNEDRKVPDAASAAAHLFDNPSRQFWFVGASWGEGDQQERFVKEGIWQNGYDSKFSDEVKAMRPGDLIAIKASFVQKHNLPFDAKGKNVSCMRIKATGTITENLGNGKTVRVAWDPATEPRDWFFFTYRNTISRADPDNDHARRLVLFTFSGILQDYKLWLSIPYFARKYGSEASNNVVDGDEDDEAEIAATVSEAPTYTLDHVIEDGCFLPREMIEDAIERLKDKKNLILQGPPGTGKTWLAKRLAYVLVGSKDRKLIRARVRSIQFHPSLSYEDFVRGWRPSEGGKLALVDGIFLKAVQAAAGEPDLPFVLVIEEINRGNPAQVFGEMLTLLEDTKRPLNPARSP
jgi:5-methylcytosine-specific restriction protein B